MMNRSLFCAGTLALCHLLSPLSRAATSNLGPASSMTGEQKQWHKVSLTFAGPESSESDSVNPFRDLRLNVTFTLVGTNHRLVVPGYFAADGDAANTSAAAGNKWRVEFAPDEVGTWTYFASFRQGKDVAILTAPDAGTPTAFDGETGTFTIDPSDKTGDDFRAKGRLIEVGQHYLQFAGSKEYFIKTGAGSPENFLAYTGFDNTTAGRKALHRYAVHLRDFRPGDPTWKGGKGKEIVGGLNYLASKGMNSLYFLTMNLNGDGDDVSPYASRFDRTRFDVSKLAQWEIVFEHMDKLGILLHVVTQEQENDQLLDGGALGAQRKLYYRELIARFGHHLGLTWNLGEENTNTAAQRDEFAGYINALDPYLHLIAVHTFPSDRAKVYTPMLGNALIHSASMQIESPSMVHEETLKWVRQSAASGVKWVVAVDEIGSAGVGVMPDANDPAHLSILQRALWGNLLAGGSGVEWYFGYNYANDDLTCEDWSSRDRMWTLSKYAADFFRSYLPLPLVANYDSLTSSTVDYCFGKPGGTYAIFLPKGATTTINLPADETYTVRWFNPRSGGPLREGSVATVSGAKAPVGSPPDELTSHWVALLQRLAPDGGGTPPPPPPPPPPFPALTISALTLVSAEWQRDVRVLCNGSIIDLSQDGFGLNIRADVAGAGSVGFVLDGKLYSSENVAPYALGGDDVGTFRKWTPSVGSHRLKVTAYSGANRSGTSGTPVIVDFTVVNSLGLPPVVVDPVPVSSVAVTNLTLLDSKNQTELRALLNGDTITYSADGAAFNIRADVSGSAGSVAFWLDGKRVGLENVVPYALAGDINGLYRSWLPAPGAHTLEVIPYEAKEAVGAAGASMQLRFTVAP